MISTLVLLFGATLHVSESQTQAATVTEQNGKAGIIAILEQNEIRLLDQAQADRLTVEKAEIRLVTSAADDEAVADTVSAAAIDTDETTEGEVTEAGETTEEATVDEEEPAETVTLSKTEQQWQDKVMANVDSSLSVRAKADKDSDIVGKMYPTSVATVIKKGETWTKIESGSVKGYVKNSYLLFGSDAYANAKKVCKTYAYVQTNGLRVRAEAAESAKVLTTANKGDKLLYNRKADKADGWIAVTVDSNTGYVAADYVKVKLGTTDALSIEEIGSLTAKAVKEPENTNAVSANSSDINLLAALIQCEAGGESYTGKVAVGAVVLNRMRSSRFPNSISGVIYQSGQFSPVRNGTLSRRLSGTISSACKQAAQEALSGTDPTSGALYFHRADGSSGLVIGHHVFY